MAKNIIKVSVKTSSVDAASAKVDLLAVGVCSDGKRLSGVAAEVNSKFGGAIAGVQKSGDFEAKAAQLAVVYGNGKSGAARVLLVGLGEKKKLTANCLRKAASAAANKAVDLKCKTLGLALHNDVSVKLETTELGKALVEGAFFGAYRYDEFMADGKTPRPKSLAVTIYDTSVAKGVKAGSIIGAAQAYARTIGNRPGNVINPVTLAAEAKKMANKTNGLTCTVFDEKKLAEMKAGGILAVGGGSATKPRMIALKYKTTAKNAKTIALVGKAVTFDSGGISIKPSAGMEEMKFDKGGGIAVLGAMMAIAGLKPKVNVIGLIPAAENMPGTGSYRPGDIVTTMSGKTVEINNTDAEGRMILCDAIHYAVSKLKVDTVIDVATLTGACVIALGTRMAGVMSDDDKLYEKIKKASESSGESVWRLPVDEDFASDMKSKIADLINTGPRPGGASTAAAFLKQFAGDTSWAHIDIAGVMETSGYGKDITAPGVGAFGVRLFSDLVSQEN